MNVHVTPPTPNIECLVAKHVVFPPNYNTFSSDVYTMVHRKLCLIAQGWWILLLG